MEDIDLTAVIDHFIQDSLNNNFFTTIGKVVATRLENQRVDVQIILSKNTTDGSNTTFTPILGVPLVYPSSNKAMLSFPVNVGDNVLLVFSQRSTDNFKLGSRDVHRPSSNRKMSMNDAIAIPGIFPFPSSPNQESKRKLKHGTQDVCLANNIGGQEVHVNLDSEGNVKVESPGNVEVKAEGNVSVENKGDVSVVNGGNTSVKSKGTVSVDSGSEVSVSIGGDPKLTVTSSSVLSTVPVTAPDFISSGIGKTFNTHIHPQEPDFGGNKENDTGVPK